MPDKWWVRPVVARPAAERDDSATVAFVWGNGRSRGLEYVTGLPRLRGIGSAEHRRLFEYSLRSLALAVRQGRPLDELEGAYSPQLHFGQPVFLRSNPTESDLVALRRMLLHTPGTVSQGRRGPRLDRRVGSVVDEIVRPSLPAFGSDYLRRKPLGTLYPLAASRLGKASNLKTLRVLRTQSKDLLLAGIVTEKQFGDDSLRKMAMKTGQVLWSLKSHRAVIQNLHGRRLRTVAFVVDGTDATGEDKHPDLAGYVSHLWQADADVVLEGAAPALTAGFKAAAEDWLR